MFVNKHAFVQFSGMEVLGDAGVGRDAFEGTLSFVHNGKIVSCSVEHDEKSKVEGTKRLMASGEKQLSLALAATLKITPPSLDIHFAHRQGGGCKPVDNTQREADDHPLFLLRSRRHLSLHACCSREAGEVTERLERR